MCGEPGCRHEQTAVKAGRSRNWAGSFAKTPGRLFGVGFIRLYQLTLSGFVGNSCRHIPTCSEYGYEAIARHGLWAGGWMALFRVARCGLVAPAGWTRFRKNSMAANAGGRRGVTGAGIDE